MQNCSSANSPVSELIDRELVCGRVVH